MWVSAMMPSYCNVLPLFYIVGVPVYVFWNLKYSEVILGGDE